ncbi:MAG: radical SAM/SPASM domain-containing protein [Candidatus Muiribacteriota bacterium]
MELQIGITDMCNMECIMCMQTAHKGLYGSPHIKTPLLHKGNKGFICPEIFKKILSESSLYDFKLLKMQWLGESFIHPQFEKILQILKEYEHFQRIVFTTNLTNIDLNIMRLIKSLKPETQIVVSLDSTETDIYKKVKGRDIYEKVYKNLETVFDFLSDTIFSIQFIIMEENFKSLSNSADFIKKRFNINTCHFDETKIYSEKNNHIFFKRLGAYNQEYYEKMHKDFCINYLNLENKPRIIKTDSVFDYNDVNRPPCRAPFETPTFNWNGQMTTCCMDSNLQLSIGNIKDANFKELWNGEKIKLIRKIHKKREFSKLTRCSRCGNL